jgi:hypothetical protein
MTGVLGYEKYAAGGCDVGALVTEQLGHKYADELYAIHLPPAIHEQIVTLEKRTEPTERPPAPARRC